MTAKATLFVLTALFVALLLPGLRGADAAPAHPASNVCGSTAEVSQALVEPPNVDVWKLPVDASGERELILSVHVTTDRYCYRYAWNGATWTIPPTIRVRRGEHFALRVVNDIGSQSKGERVASTRLSPCLPMRMPPAKTVRYVGYLNHTIDDRYMPLEPQLVDTNLHLHGFQGPADEENVFLSTLSTRWHACEYHITIPFTQPPGTYFYHPHAHGGSDVEVASGLAGAWIVEPQTPQLPRSADHVLMLRYTLSSRVDNPFAPSLRGIARVSALHEEALKPGREMAHDPFDPPPWPVTYPNEIGSTHLDPTGCNGLAGEPWITIDGADAPASLDVAAGRTQLLRLVNGTSDSSKLLVMRDAAGHVLPMRVVGLDGTPVSGDMTHPLSQYLPMKRVMLTPMARAGVLVDLAPGQTVTISSEHYCSGSDEFYQMHDMLLRVRGVRSAGSGPVLRAVSVRVADTPASKLVAFANAHPSLIHRRAITFTEYAFPRRGKIRAHQGFYITDTTNPNFHEHPFWPVFARGGTVPLNPDVVVHAGTIEEWYLINATMEVHAFHIHQTSFVALAGSGGIPLTVDSLIVPVGTLLPNPKDPDYPLIRPSITRILLDFRHVLKGTFVFHCHMLFHEDRGMMGVIKVE